MQHNEILHVGDIARITEKEVLQLSIHVAIVTKVYTRYFNMYSGALLMLVNCITCSIVASLNFTNKPSDYVLSKPGLFSTKPSLSIVA